MYFKDRKNADIENIKFSSPFIEERLYLNLFDVSVAIDSLFSSPFIEERLYLKGPRISYRYRWDVLVPFYRGAVVFIQGWADKGVKVF